MNAQSSFTVRFIRPGGHWRVVVVRGAVDTREAQDAVVDAYELCPATGVIIERATEEPLYGAEEIRVGGAPAPVMPRLPRHPVPAKKRVAA